MAYVRPAAPPGLGDAAERYGIFHRRPPSELLRVPCRREIPEVLVGLGELRAVIYRSNRGRQGLQRTYVHFLEDPPTLACDPEGRQLYVVGGNYRVTDRGIEG